MNTIPSSATGLQYRLPPVIPAFSPIDINHQVRYWFKKRLGFCWLAAFPHHFYILKNDQVYGSSAYLEPAVLPFVLLTPSDNLLCHRELDGKYRTTYKARFMYQTAARWLNLAAGTSDRKTTGLEVVVVVLLYAVRPGVGAEGARVVY